MKKLALASSIAFLSSCRKPTSMPYHYIDANAPEVLEYCETELGPYTPQYTQSNQIQTQIETVKKCLKEHGSNHSGYTEYSGRVISEESKNNHKENTSEGFEIEYDSIDAKIVNQNDLVIQKNESLILDTGFNGSPVNGTTEQYKELLNNVIEACEDESYRNYKLTCAMHWQFSQENNNSEQK